eukprot:COSAG02_NODE_48_length_45421_cov_103.222100_23_plen_106_part_00
MLGFEIFHSGFDTPVRRFECEFVFIGSLVGITSAVACSLPSMDVQFWGLGVDSSLQRRSRSRTRGTENSLRKARQGPADQTVGAASLRLKFRWHSSIRWAGADDG